MFPSDVAERFMLRLPDGLRDRIREVAARNRRSMNSEIVLHLERAFPVQCGNHSQSSNALEATTGRAA